MLKCYKKTKKPIVYIGGGVINSGISASKQLYKFLKYTHFPCTQTLMGLGSYPTDDYQFLGMLGMHGTYEANLAMHQSDLMICIGARFDDRITGKVSGFSPKSKKVHIDIDASSFNKSVNVDLTIKGDIAKVLTKLNMILDKKGFKFKKENYQAWYNKIEKWKKKDCLNFKK